MRRAISFNDVNQNKRERVAMQCVQCVLVYVCVVSDGWCVAG